MITMLLQKPFFKYVPAITWSGIIFLVCLIPGNDLPHDDFFDKIHLDKIVHATLYFILFLLLLYGMKQHAFKLNRKLTIDAIVCIAQGILIELLQGSSLIKNRSFEFADIAANVCGVLIAVVYTTLKNKNE